MFSLNRGGQSLKALRYNLPGWVMAEEERVKRIVRLREILLKRVEELEAELSGLKEVLRFVDELLKELSFRRPPPPEAGPPPEEEARLAETRIPLTTVEGELLATMFIGPSRVRIVPAEGKKFHVSSRPFRYFIKQLQGMQDRDASLVAEGRLSPDEVVSFNVVKEGDVVKEVVIKNVRPEDMRNLRSLARWTFRTMWEQMAGAA